MIRASLVIFTASFILAACSSQEKADYEQAQKAIDQGHFRVAAGYLDRVIKRNSGNTLTLDAAREAARISFYEIKDYKKAIQYFQFLVLHSKSPEERLQSQRQVASINFDNLQDYNQSIAELSKLLEMPHNEFQETQYRLNLARAYFYLGNYFQSLSELDSLLSKKSNPDIRFGALTLKGNILVAQKQFGKAVDVFKSLISSYPEKSMKENIGLTLAVCYEENDNFKGAIQVLEDYRGNYNPPEYIELRIKRLQERLKNAPGAKGFRK